MLWELNLIPASQANSPDQTGLALALLASLSRSLPLAHPSDIQAASDNKASDGVEPMLSSVAPHCPPSWVYSWIHPVLWSLLDAYTSMPPPKPPPFVDSFAPANFAFLRSAMCQMTPAVMRDALELIGEAFLDDAPLHGWQRGRYVEVARAVGEAGAGGELGGVLLGRLLGGNGAKARRRGVEGQVTACYIELLAGLLEGGGWGGMGWGGKRAREVERVLDMSVWSGDEAVRGAGRRLLTAYLSSLVRPTRGHVMRCLTSLPSRFDSLAFRPHAGRSTARTNRANATGGEAATTEIGRAHL